MSNAAAAPESASGTDFSFRLFHTLTADTKPGQNVIVSPSSAYYALSMTANGAEGKTQTQMLGTLGAKSSLEELNKNNRSAISALRGADKSVVIEVANAIFVNDKVKVQPTFLETCKSDYDADAQAIDMTKPAVALKAINSWCSDHTHGKIPTILNDVNNVVMVLLNAIYFNGTWESQFDKKLTSDQQFNLSDGTQKTVQMMQKQRFFNYYEDDRFASIEMPYKGRTFSLFVFLPNKDVSLKQFCAKFDAAAWSHAQDKFLSQQINVRMPKFKIEYSVVLNQTIRVWGCIFRLIPTRRTSAAWSNLAVEQRCTSAR